MPRKKKTDDPIGVGLTAKQMRRKKPINADLLVDIDPLTDNQEKFYKEYDEGKHIFAYGCAGTGKTFIALYKAIKEVLDLEKPYEKIYIVRSLVSTREIGFLPGDIQSKINPYMEPLWDNLKFIQNQYNQTDKEFKALRNMIDTEKLLIQPLAYIRGRSFSNIFFIIDEAQNLTPHEIKTIISRAGDNTKVVFIGDIYQIDTPYLDSQSNGLSYLIDRLKKEKIYSHVTLKKGERSELANLANDLL